VVCAAHNERSSNQLPEGVTASLQRAAIRVFICTLVLLHPLAQGRTNQQWGNGLEVEIDHPVDQVLAIVKEVVADGYVRGTSQYRDTSQLDGATPATSSNLFKDWTEGGTVLFKVRPKTLSPEHFDDSNDVGTVAVRYVVQPLGKSSTRLRIDAVFQTDARRSIHPSDGTPENGEYLVIAERIKDAEEKEAQRKRDAATAVQEEQISRLQSSLDKEVAELKDLNDQQQELEKELQQLRPGRSGHIRTSTADLKTSPYNQSNTLQHLSQGDAVTILGKTQNWYEVITSNGAQGWIYSAMVEVIP
jgi:hypothetical protein